MEKQQNNYSTKSGWSLDKRDPEFIQSVMPLWEFFYKYYFRVQTSGWENVSLDEKALYVGSHNGGLAAPDMIMMMYDWFRHVGTQKQIYGLMHPHVWNISLPMAELAAKTGAIVAHPKMAIAALQTGASLLVYPGGAQDIFRPYHMRHQIYFAGRKGFIKLAIRENVPIIPMISVGAHDTLIVIADFYKIVNKFHELGMPWFLGLDPEVFPIYLGLPWGLAVGPLPNIPLPTTIHTRVCPKIVFERYGAAASRDSDYVNTCYELVLKQMQQELDDLVAKVYS
ncbi:MAG: acyltransferase family protein [Calothrix sp. SM1_7_51]|nr:acyltransferase family protein [Calothrix sp. SM1_7_51]